MSGFRSGPVPGSDWHTRRRVGVTDSLASGQPDMPNATSRANTAAVSGHTGSALSTARH
jgi:hypothetical protein